ncbi:alpha/beta hydrolase [Candidatus Woesearchaeota archaeon]|nr:alpha/beta hydrolase [Candidatus Woesearchaeota archaeon]
MKEAVDAYILHGRGSAPHKTFIPWLMSELIGREYNVVAPAMPRANFPSFKKWYHELDNLIVSYGQPRIFTGHSASTHTIMHYVTDKQLSPEGIYLVAPFQNLDHTGIYKKTAYAMQEKRLPDLVKKLINKLSIMNSESWCRRDLPWDKLKDYQSVLHLYFSEDDYIVPASQIELFVQKLPDAHITVEKNMGHFDTASGTKKYDQLLEDIVDVLKSGRF